MRRTGCYVVLAALAAMSADAQAVGGLTGVTIVDRETGVALTPHYFHGEYWIAGRPGARYAIEIRNRAAGPGRLLVVTSVDGVNVLSGETAGWGQTGYVLDPGQQYQITGWRKSDTEVAAFTFTSLPDSYAARTGRPQNVGVIGVAVFRERKVPPPVVYEPPSVAEPAPDRDSLSAEGGNRAQSGAASPPPSAAAVQKPSTSAKEERLGTGHGQREYSYVSHTEFDRMQSEPNEVIRIRYDSLENLMAMGIIRRPRPMPPAADPFPATPDQYVPDPPG